MLLLRKWTWWEGSGRELMRGSSSIDRQVSSGLMKLVDEKKALMEIGRASCRERVS